MARFPAAEAVLKAADEWKNECLLDEGSLLSDRKLWTLANFRELHHFYVENLDEGEGDFLSKLERQLAPAPPDVPRLMAEVFWVLFLIVHESWTKPETKRFQIKKAWEWSGEALQLDQPRLQELLGQGVISPGTAYNTHRWREVVFFVATMCDWFALSRNGRQELLADPWVFAEWLENREHAAGRQFRHVVLFLLFPETFERIATASHKRDIIRAFRREWKIEEEFDWKDRIALDRELLTIRHRLEQEAGDGGVDFYEPPAEHVWRVKETPPDAPLPDTEAEGWFTERFGDVRAWLLSPGEGARLWRECQEKGIAVIGWDGLGDLNEFESKEEVLGALTAQDSEVTPTHGALANWQFAHEMQPGDLVIAKQGRSKVLGWGLVVGPYTFDPDRIEYLHVRPVDWKETGSWTLPKSQRVTNKPLTERTDSKEWIKWVFDFIATDRDEGGGSREQSYDVDEAVRDIFLPPDEFSRILDTLARRKNLILQGPPGVGKTFLARRLAWCLTGKKGSSDVEMVQFHQSYAYEDFIQGWRPTEGGGFALRDGVFYRFCARARANPTRSFVFLIDEINRGNLSRIFGELLLLIEPDKRGDEFAIPLTYGKDDERFSVPENVHLIGMMNTADRSLAMVDYALRRRFAFITLHPAFGTERFLSFLVEAELDGEVIELLDARLRQLNGEIAADTRNLGPGFQIGHSYFVPDGQEEKLDAAWYRAVIRTQVAPLLEEYWFDQPDRAEKFLDLLLA